MTVKGKIAEIRKVMVQFIKIKKTGDKLVSMKKVQRNIYRSEKKIKTIIPKF